MTPTAERETLLLRGSLDLCVLRLLSCEPMHAYAVVRRLGEHGFDQSTHGTIYPLVTRLRRTGLIEQHATDGQGGPARHVLSLTEQGEEALADWTAQWQKHRDRVDGLLSTKGARRAG